MKGGVVALVGGRRYFALDGTDHRSHTEQNTASPPASGAAAPAPSPRSTS